MAGSNLTGRAAAARRKVRGTGVELAEAAGEAEPAVPELPVQAAKASAVVAKVPVSNARRDTRFNGISGTGITHLPLGKYCCFAQGTSKELCAKVFIKDSALKRWLREPKLPEPSTETKSLAAVHEVLAVVPSCPGLDLLLEQLHHAREECLGVASVMRNDQGVGVLPQWMIGR